MIFARLGRFQEALTCYNRSLSIKFDQPQAQYDEFDSRDGRLDSRLNSSPVGIPPYDHATERSQEPLWLGGDEDLSLNYFALSRARIWRYPAMRALRSFAQERRKVVLVAPGSHFLMHSLPAEFQPLLAGATPHPINVRS